MIVPFFDKRSKFVHYAPRTAILNNLEFDHADIFDDLEAIQRQFHQLIRTVPGNGLLIVPHGEATIERVLRMGNWTPKQQFGVAVSGGSVQGISCQWRRVLECGTKQTGRGSEFELTTYGQGSTGEVMCRALRRVGCYRCT